MTNENTQLIFSSNQSHALYHTFFSPIDYASDEGNEVKATLLILHGMSEHSGRYEKFAEFLATQGIAVLTYDCLGHGKTAKSADELGFFDEQHPMQVLLKDTIIMAEAIKARHPEIPHFIMGHSMGSFVVRNLLKHHSHAFSGSILMGTSDKDIVAKVLMPVFYCLNRISSKKISSFGSNTTHKILLNKLGLENTEAFHHSWLTENTDNIEAFKADPLCGFDFTNNGYMTLATLMNGALNMPWYKSIRVDYPIMVVSGKDDPVGNMGKGIDSLVSHLQSKGMTGITKVLYPNMRHEPLHETDKHIVYRDIANWILNRL